MQVRGLFSSLKLILVHLLTWWCWIFSIFFGEKPTLRSIGIEHRNKKRQFSGRQIQDEVWNRRHLMCQNSPLVSRAIYETDGEWVAASLRQCLKMCTLLSCSRMFNFAMNRENSKHLIWNFGNRNIKLIFTPANGVDFRTFFSSAGEFRLKRRTFPYYGEYMMTNYGTGEYIWTRRYMSRPQKMG